MAKTITLDFLRGYQLGTRRESTPVAYQYDEGHMLEVRIPTSVTTAEIQYWIRGMDKAEAYTPGEITAEDDGTYTIEGNIPNSFFEHSGDLRVYVVVTDDSASVVTYEGYIHIVDRQMPEDYVDDDPENEATRVLIEAQEAAATATAAAETCEEVAESIPEDYSALSQDVTDLKADLADINLSSVKFFTRHLGVINQNATAWIYTSDPNWQYTIIPITAYSKIYIKASGLNVVWTFLKSYDSSVAPDLSSVTTTRQNNDYNGVVPSDASYLYLQLKYNGADTIPPHLIIDGWDYGISAKAQLLADLDTLSDAVLSNTPIDIIKSNALVIESTSWTSGTVNVGFENPDVIILGGSYSSGAQRITRNTAVLKANTKYTFFVKNIDGLKPSVGLASSAGFINYNENKVETSEWNKPVVFETGSSELTGVYAYLRVTASALNNKVEIYVIEGEHSVDEFYIYGNEYKSSRLNGKKVAWYGDSITQGYVWCTILNGLFHFDAVNCGSGGSRISYTSSRNDSMCLATRMQGDYTPTSGTATAIPTDVEVIFVEGGTNDWGNNVTLGNVEFVESPDYSIYAEACHMMFDNLTTLFPNAEIIVLGSPWAKWANHFTDTYGILNNNGLQTVDYGDILLDVAGRWGIKGINMSRLLGFNDNNISDYTSDGIHPITGGAKIIADVVAKYLLTV